MLPELSWERKPGEGGGAELELLRPEAALSPPCEAEAVWTENIITFTSSDIITLAGPVSLGTERRISGGAEVLESCLGEEVSSGRGEGSTA